MRATAITAVVFTALVCGGCGDGRTVGEIEVGLTPLAALQGETVTLFVSGVGTSFVAVEPDGSTDPVVSIQGEGTGLVLGDVSVDTPHRARVVLTVDPDAPPSSSAGLGPVIRVETAGETFDFSFHVQSTSDLPAISLDQDSGLAGTASMLLGIRALGGTTAFDTPAIDVCPGCEGVEDTIVGFPEDSGVHLVATTVETPDSLVAEISIDHDAPEASFPVTVTTGGDVATAPFQVYRPLDTRLYVVPPEGQRGEDLDVTLVVSGMEILADDLDARFPFNPWLAIEDLERTGASTASAVISIDDSAPVGSWQIVLSSGGQEASSMFRVLPTAGTEPFLRLHPSILTRGTTGAAVALAGVYTSFEDGVSTLEITPGTGITAESLEVAGPSSATVELTVADDAPAESSIVTLTTGEEVASGLLTVVEPSALWVSVSPSEVERGSEDVLLSLDVDGADLLSAGSVEVSFDDGSGIVVGDVAITSSTSAEVHVDVSGTAPTGGALLWLDVEDETASAPVWVTAPAGQAVFTVDPPVLSLPAGEVEIRLEGEGTDWTGGHALSFSQRDIDVVDFAVLGPGEAVATVFAPPWIDVRRSVVFVASPSDVQAAWWTLVPPQHRSVVLSPAEVVMGSTHRIRAEGDGTGFVEGLTAALTSPDSRVRVNSVQVFEPDLAWVEVEVGTDAAPTTHGLTLVTGGELGLATFSVVDSPHPIGVDLDPVAVEVGTTSTLALAGEGTHFQAGETIVEASVDVYKVPLGLDMPTSIDAATQSITVDITPDASLAGTVIPVSVTTDLEVVRDLVAILADPGDPWVEFSPTRLHAWTTTTLDVTLSPSAPLDFTLSPPDMEPITVGATVTDLTVVGPSALTATVDVSGGSDLLHGAVELELSSGGYVFRLVVPVAETDSLVAVPSSTIESGTRAGTLEVQGRGFQLVSPLMEAASPDRLLFVDGIESTGTHGAQIAYHTAIRESDTVTLVHVVPTAVGWSVPLELEMQAADLRVVGVPSSVLETVPPGGWDLIGFTPDPGESLAIWAVASDDWSPMPWDLIGPDGISRIMAGCDERVVELSWTEGTRYWVRAGGDALVGQDYWLSVVESLASASEEIEPNDDWTTAQGIADPGPASVLLGLVDGSGDVDHYRPLPPAVPTCWQVVSRDWMGCSFTSPFVEMKLLDDGGLETASMVGWSGEEGLDPILCSDATGSPVYVSVEGVAGTSGAYLLVPRWPLIVTELDHGLVEGPYVEISGAPEYPLDGWVLEVIDASSGTSLGQVDLSATGTLPASGRLVVASPSASMPEADLDDAALDLMIPPYAVRVIHAIDGSSDAVQVGGTAGHGEGPSVLDPAIMPAGRTWDLDTDDNAGDFSGLVAPSPGSPNALPLP